VKIMARKMEGNIGKDVAGRRVRDGGRCEAVNGTYFRDTPHSINLHSSYLGKLFVNYNEK
jgi:hypothetical protein